MSDKDSSPDKKENSVEWDLTQLSPEEQKRREEEQKFITESLAEILQYIINHYEPASAASATITKTTQEIFQEVNELFPAPFSPMDVFKLLKGSGFSYGTPEKDLSFTWLMKPRISPIKSMSFT
jgi:hypothetical protein